MKLLMITIAIFSFISTSANAEKLSTNIENVFIKKTRCHLPGTDYSRIKFSISNKSTMDINQNVIITVIDEDGDPIDNNSTRINIAAMSGKAFGILIECEPNYTYGFRFE